MKTDPPSGHFPRPDLQPLLSRARQLSVITQGLAANLTTDSPERFARALQQVAERSGLLVKQLESPAGLDLRDRVVRHDLRAHLALVIGYAELWHRRAAQELASGEPAGPFSRHLDALALIIDTARQTLAQLDSLTATLQTAEAPPPPPLLPLPPLPSGLFTLTSQSSKRGDILVVDDTSTNRDLLRALLEHLGHTVETVGSGQEALTLLERRSFDLILLDVLMPEMDGFTVLTRLKDHPDWRHIPVLMVSALDREEGVINCIARGAEDYLTRPFNELLLRARVNASLEKKRLRDRERDHLRCIDRLLHAIFPPEVVTELTEKGAVQPRRHEKVGVCFIDVVGFTRFCDRHANQPEHIVRLLEWYIETFEEVARQHHVQKIKTIGDAFLMVAGLLQPSANPVLQLVRCSEDLLRAVLCGPAGWQIRIGIHVGPVVAGTLGESQYSYDLWGSTVNIAARMESSGIPNTITLSDEAWKEIAAVCHGRPRDASVRGLLGPVTIWEFLSFREGGEVPATTGGSDTAGISGAASPAPPAGRD